MQSQVQTNYQQILPGVYILNKKGNQISKGYDSNLKKSLKIKTIKSCKSFRQEKIRVVHRNVLSLLDTVQKGGYIYILYEDYLYSLKELLTFKEQHGKAFSSAQVFDIFVEIVEGMSHLHEKFIIHGSLNPSNIYFAKQEQETMRIKKERKQLVKIGDYTKIKDYRIEEDEENWKLYSSPPQMSKNSQCYKDFWSAGVILLELLTTKNFKFVMDMPNNLAKNRIEYENKGKNNSNTLKLEQQISSLFTAKGISKQWIPLLNMLFAFSGQVNCKKLKNFMQDNKESLKSMEQKSQQLQSHEKPQYKIINKPPQYEEGYTIFFNKQLEGHSFDCYECQNNSNKKKLRAFVFRSQDQKSRFNRQNFQSLDHFNLLKIQKVQQRLLERYREEKMPSSKSIQQQSKRKQIICYSEYYGQNQSQSLHQLIYSPKPLQQVQILQIFIQLLQLFSYLSQKKRVHNCLNPKNIIVTSDNKIKIDPFQTILVQEGKQLQFSLILQQYSYYPPQVILQGKFQKNSNLWTLGLILYEMLMKQKPYEEYQKNIWGTVDLDKHLIKNMKSLRLPQGYDGQFCRLIKYTTIYNYKERPEIIQVVQYMRQISQMMKDRLEKVDKKGSGTSQVKSKKV